MEPTGHMYTQDELIKMMEDFNKETISLIDREYFEKGKIYNHTMEQALIRLPHYKRSDFFLDMIMTYPMTPSAYRNAFRFVWTTDRMDEDTAVEILSKIGLKRMLNAKEKALFDSLPQMITIYRGTHQDEEIPSYYSKYPDFHISWSLRREVAEFFAFRGKHFPKEDGRVYSIRVRKANIFALLLERGEFEVLYPYSFGKYQRPYKLVTDAPTECYDNFMKEKENQWK